MSVAAHAPATPAAGQPLQSVLLERVQPIIDAIGFDGALHLVARRGGTRVYVSASPEGALAAAIGAHRAEMLTAAIGAGVLDVPKCMAWMLARRNEEICARYLYGETQADLAVRFGLTERRIWSILHTNEDGWKEPGDPGLFDGPPDETNPSTEDHAK